MSTSELYEKRIGFTDFESGTFTLSADGTAATGGTLINPGANPTLRITTAKRLKLWYGNIAFLSLINIGSDGRSDGVINNNLNRKSDDGTLENDQINCINVQDAGGNGWTGLITAINDTSFDITFTQVGVGLAITGQWHGIME